MKPLATALATHCNGNATTLAWALKVTRTDGAVYAFTSANIGVPIGGVFYSASQGLDISAIASTAGLSVDNLEITTLDDESLFTHAAVIGGIWQGASFLIFRYNWANPTDGTEPVMAGTFGGVTLRRGSVVVELRGLQQYLQQPVGNVTSKTCRARFADYPRPNASNICGLDAAAWTVAHTVGAVASRRQFAITRVSGVALVDDWLTEGLLTFTSGPNAGQIAKVRSHASGVVTLATDLPYLPATGNAFNALAGCRKRLDEDCATKFSNARRFQGEPHRPSIDTLTASAEPAG